MNIDYFDWKPQFEDKIWYKHGITPDEVEESFYNHPLIRKVENGKVSGEHVYQLFGYTDTDRYLSIIYIYKQPNTALIISARDMTRKEKQYYDRRKK